MMRGSMLMVICLGVLILSTVDGSGQFYCQRGFKHPGNPQYELDLSKLDHKFVVEEFTETLPARTKIQTQINICNPLDMDDVKDEQDRCSADTYVCRRKIFIKSNQPDYVAVVQTLANDRSNHLNAAFKPVGSADDPSKYGTQYSLTLGGGNDLQREQSVSITLECADQDRNGPVQQPVPATYINNVLTVTWKTVHACAYKVGERPPDSGKDGNAETSSGAWTLIKILLVMASIYLIGGALYNFNQYNARGLDLIPHRDFWLDLPYVIRDLISHCVGSVISRRRGGGGQGYVAV